MFCHFGLASGCGPCRNDHCNKARLRSGSAVGLHGLYLQRQETGVTLVDELLDAACQRDKALLVQEALVAGVQPAACTGLLSQLWVHAAMRCWAGLSCPHASLDLVIWCPCKCVVDELRDAACQRDKALIFQEALVAGVQPAACTGTPSQPCLGAALRCKIDPTGPMQACIIALSQPHLGLTLRCKLIQLSPCKLAPGS